MKLRPDTDPVTIRCAICLNRGARVAAVTTVKGYAVCTEHIDLVSQPEFDIFAIQTHGKHVL